MKKRDNRYLYRNKTPSKTDDTVLPATVDDIIKLVDETFPPFNATLDMNSDEIRFKAGQRNVAEWLNNLLKEKNKNVYVRKQK